MTDCFRWARVSYLLGNKPGDHTWSKPRWEPVHLVNGETCVFSKGVFRIEAWGDPLQHRTPRPLADRPELEAFDCPHCGQHIKDALLTRYTARRALALRDPKSLKAGTGRPPKVTAEQRDVIRRRRRAGETLAAIAADYQISIATVSRISEEES